jgi:hypothetical protein
MITLATPAVQASWLQLAAHARRGLALPGFRLALFPPQGLCRFEMTAQAPTPAC